MEHIYNTFTGYSLTCCFIINLVYNESGLNTICKIKRLNNYLHHRRRCIYVRTMKFNTFQNVKNYLFMAIHQRPFSGNPTATVYYPMELGQITTHIN